MDRPAVEDLARSLQQHTDPARSVVLLLVRASECGGALTGMCADGVSVERAKQRKLTRHRPLRCWFGRPGWRFRANIASHRVPDEEACQLDFRARRAKPRLFVLKRPAQAGIYEVHLWGNGPEGQVHTTFTWRVGKWRTSTC